MTGFKLIQTIGLSGMKLESTGFYTFSFEDSKIIAQQILKELIKDSATNDEDLKYTQMLSEVMASSIGKSAGTDESGGGKNLKNDCI